MANWTVGKIIGAQLAALACAAVAPAPAGALGACDAQKRLHPEHRRGAGRPALALGDSVMLGAAPALAQAGFEVDARGCRQMKAGIAVLAHRRRAHRLPRVVVVALGTNLDVTRGDIRRALRVLGRQRLLILVTPNEDGGGGGSDAAVIRRAGRRHRARLAVADWVRASAGHDGWTGGDGIHLGPAGIRAFVRVLRPYVHARPHQPLRCRWRALMLRARRPGASGG